MRKRAGIQIRIVQGEANAAVVEPAATGAEVAECGGLAEGRIGGVVHAAIDEEAVVRFLAGLGHRLAIGVLVRLGGIGGGVYVGFLKAILRRSHGGNRVLLAASWVPGPAPGLPRPAAAGWGPRWPSRSSQAVGRRRACPPGKHLQLPFRAGRGGRHRHFPLNRREAQHLDANLPDPFVEVPEKCRRLADPSPRSGACRPGSRSP